MRSLLLFCAFLMAVKTSAQVYSQNEPPVQQVQLPTDCYTNNLDRGNAAMRRGDTKEALRYFKAARNCEEVQSNSRRLAEVDSRIMRAEEALGIRTDTKIQSEEKSVASAANTRRKFSSEPPSVRRNYKASQNILNDTLEDCFQRMTEEADRAYRLKFWEDAAALYRAAKNCSDADQTGRQLMSEKIVQCRNAAENELFAKQQEAERQARHAIAANLADDAQELLESSDRSLAFRLADFANQYVAPDDNPDCVQAIFDTWYYQPSETTLPYRNDQLHHPVFTYEIAENYGNQVQLKFSKDKNENIRLWTFAPETGEVNVRSTPQFQVLQSFSTGEDAPFFTFDVSPLEDVLLVAKPYLELRRGARQHRIYGDSIINWCFSPRGDEFLFENNRELKIYLLNINQVFNQQASRKGAKSGNVVGPPAEPREIVSGISPGLLTMEYYAGKIWLGYSNRIEVLSKSEPGKPWKKEYIWYENVSLPASFEQKHLKLKLFPGEEFAVLGYFNQTWIIPMLAPSDQQDSTLVFPGHYYNNLIPLAICPQTHQIACKDTLDYLHQGFWLIDVFSGDTLTHQNLPVFSSFNGMSGAFSPDGAWIASDNAGIITIWALREAATKYESSLPFVPDDNPLFSADGSKLFATSENTITVLATKDLTPIYSLQGLGTPLRGVSNDWIMTQVSTDSAEVSQISSGKRLRFPAYNPDVFPFPYTMDSKGEKWVAFAAWDKVEVRSLLTGALLASRRFEGGSISQLYAVPNKDELLLVLDAETGTSGVKLWSFSGTEQKIRTMRLHQYSVNAVAIDPGSQRVALSDENDIRIFDLQNIENEALKIRSN
ncbi:MAG: WD40 repeat domain-containing protein, partial [Saprospiraceae bacterium]|nr:WD40 repeat domain-containing protein [Saprospiraceae bacterium]